MMGHGVVREGRVNTSNDKVGVGGDKENGGRWGKVQLMKTEEGVENKKRRKKEEGG